ncbi:hypothetical protein ISN76_18480 [Dyella halodurans]
MIARSTSRSQLHTRFDTWLDRARRIARQMGYLAPAAAPVPLTRRQSLLLAQDSKKAQETARRLTLVRSIKGEPWR